MSGNKNKGKDKGKSIRRSEDYQMVVPSVQQHPSKVPVYNKFQPLDNYPSLPYKTAVTKPPSKSTSDNSYTIRHTEHLFLTTYKDMPPTDAIRPLVQKVFGNRTFVFDHPQKTQQFYELILVDTQSADISHTYDKINTNHILFSKCIIKQVLSAKQWKDPFEERLFSIPFAPQTFDYNDYRMAWFRAFLFQLDTHSWFYNCHDSCPLQFPIWFYYWWTWFGCSLSVLPTEAQGGWNFWEKNMNSLGVYTKEVQFFRIFNVAWIFCWEYRLQIFLKNSFPLSLVRVYKIKWWNEFKTKLCGSENVEHSCRTKTKRFTLHNLHTFDGQTGIGPSTPRKKDSPASSKSKTKGLTIKEKEVLEYLKDDPQMRQIFLQKILDKANSSDDEVSSTASNAKQKDDMYQDSQDPYDM